MVRYATGEMFDQLGQPNQIVLATANASVGRAHNLVMGRGAAAGLLARRPGVDFVFGSRLLERNCAQRGLPSRVALSIAPYWLEMDGEQQCGVLQVKRVWWEDAEIGLIAGSLQKLAEVAQRRKKLHYHVNFPGIGAGRLERRCVLPLLEGLPDNVTIWETSMTKAATKSRCGQGVDVRNEGPP